MATAKKLLTRNEDTSGMIEQQGDYVEKHNSYDIYASITSINGYSSLYILIFPCILLSHVQKASKYYTQLTCMNCTRLIFLFSFKIRLFYFQTTGYNKPPAKLKFNHLELQQTMNQHPS